MNKYIDIRGVIIYLLNFIISLSLYFDKSIFAAILIIILFYPINFILLGDIFMSKTIKNFLILWYGIHTTWLIIFLIHL